MPVRGGSPGFFFKLQDGHPLTKSHFSQQLRTVFQAIGFPYQNFAGHSFWIGCKGWYQRFHNTSNGLLEQWRLPDIH